MKKRGIIAVVGLLFIGCSTKDESFCACMDAGEKLNDYAQHLMVKPATEKQAKELKELRTKKDKACAAYKTMDGPTMLEKKKTCAE